MKADVSRSTFDPQHQYSAVLMQQGRVQIDADWNEQQAIHRHRADAFACNVIGASGMPISGATGVAAGFRITDAGGRLRIGKGHGYVGGLLCLNGDEADAEQTIPIEKQPFWRDPTDPPESAEVQPGLVYLEAWERHVTAVDEPGLLEPALDGVDTTTRVQTIWQVKFAPVVGDVQQTWNRIVDPWSAVGAGAMRVDVPAPGVCAASGLVAPGSGYRGLENTLFRVEIFQGGTASLQAAPEAHYVWARDNASFLTSVVDIAEARFGESVAAQLTLASLGRDEFSAYAAGDFVAVHTRSSERDAAWDTPPGRLFKVEAVKPEDLAIVVTAIAGAPSEISFLTDLIGTGSLILARRWDNTALVTADERLALRDNIHVVFSPGRYRTGDAWQIPVRASQIGLHGDDQGDILWPLEAEPARARPSRAPAYRSLPSHTPAHRFCQLALITGTAGSFEVQDLRPIFPQLTGLVRLVHVSGQGQVAQIGIGGSVPDLSAFEVQVVNWNTPVEGANVRFAIESTGDPNPSNPGFLYAAGTEPPPTSGPSALTLETGVGGVAACIWQPRDPNSARTHRVTAALVPADDAALKPPVIHFMVSVVESGSDVSTGFHVTHLSLAGSNRPLDNDFEVTADELAGGFLVHCSMLPDDRSLNYRLPGDISDRVPNWRESKPSCVVMLDLPFPIRDSGSFWGANQFGHQPVLIASRLGVAREAGDRGAIKWQPRDDVRAVLQKGLDTTPAVTGKPRRIPGHLTIRGDAIWAQDRPQITLLDGLVSGRPDPSGTTALDFGRARRGDLAVCFWLVQVHGVGLVVNWQGQLKNVALKDRHKIQRILDHAISHSSVQGPLRDLSSLANPPVPPVPPSPGPPSLLMTLLQKWFAPYAGYETVPDGDEQIAKSLVQEVFGTAQVTLRCAIALPNMGTDDERQKLQAVLSPLTGPPRGGVKLQGGGVLQFNLPEATMDSPDATRLVAGIVRDRQLQGANPADLVLVPQPVADFLRQVAPTNVDGSFVRI
jgi:hypothetical protein